MTTLPLNLTLPIGMSIIEFACTSLPPPTDSQAPQLLKNLVTVTDVIQASSHLPTRFFSSTTDDRVMFVIGGWPSQSAHQDGFDGSTEQAKLFPLIEGMMQIDWMEYLDTKHDNVPTGSQCLVATVLRCGVLKDDARQQTWDGLQQGLKAALEKQEGQGSQTGIPIVCAWNLKKGKQDGEEDVLVCFSGWENAGAASQFVDGLTGTGLPELVKKSESYFMKRTELPGAGT